VGGMSRDTGKIPSKRHVESFRLRERLEPIRHNSYWDVGCVTLCKRQGRGLKMRKVYPITKEQVKQIHSLWLIKELVMRVNVKELIRLPYAELHFICDEIIDKVKLAQKDLEPIYKAIGVPDNMVKCHDSMRLNESTLELMIYLPEDFNEKMGEERKKKMPEKQKIIVTVSDGIVCEVYSTEKDTIVEVIDYDSEDCEYADEQVGKLVERMHKIY
jgi:hypothetical protein